MFNLGKRRSILMSRGIVLRLDTRCRCAAFEENKPVRTVSIHSLQQVEVNSEKCLEAALRQSC